MALVPCCHTKRSLSSEQLQEYAKTTVDNNANDSNMDGGRPIQNYSLADIIDQHRIHRLQDAGFHVLEATIPPVFTPKNRIILATPPSTMTEGSEIKVQTLPLTYNNNKNKSNLGWAMPKFSISVADTPMARAHVRSMAGRIAAIKRKQDPPRSLNVSLLLPPQNTHLSAQDLQAALVPGAHIEAVCPEAFWHPTEQRYARTFMVTYRQGHTKKECKEMHQQLRETIPILFPGAQVRY